MSYKTNLTRCENVGRFLTEYKATVRRAAKQFGISKSTVHKDVTVRLKYENPSLYEDVKKLLCINKAERHIRGGEATKRKYMLIRREREEKADKEKSD